jgi:hypothetical protein
MSEQTPIVLELAPLPREQIGPFLLLGVSKDADREQIEAHWAERIKAARKSQIRVPLEDINWAREILNDVERRMRSASATLNPDTAEELLKKLAAKYGLADTAEPSWKPYESEKALADYTPPIALPDLEEIHSKIAVPEVPFELPAVAVLVKQFVPQALDPWDVNLEGEPPPSGSPNESREPHHE